MRERRSVCAINVAVKIVASEESLELMLPDHVIGLGEFGDRLGKIVEGCG